MSLPQFVTVLVENLEGTFSRTQLIHGDAMCVFDICQAQIKMKTDRHPTHFLFLNIQLDTVGLCGADFL